MKNFGISNRIYIGVLTLFLLLKNFSFIYSQTAQQKNKTARLNQLYYQLIKASPDSIDRGKRYVEYLVIKEGLFADASLKLTSLPEYKLNRIDSAITSVKRIYSMALSINDTTILKSAGLYLAVFYRQNHNPIQDINKTRISFMLTNNLT